MSEPAGAQRRKIVLRPARPADVRAIYELVRPYADRRILIAKDLIAYFEDVQEFTVAEEVSADTGGATGSTTASGRRCWASSSSAPGP